MVDKKGRTNQKLFSSTNNYNPENGYFTGKTPSKVGEIGESVFNLGQSEKYWVKHDIYGIGRLAGWSLAGLTVAGIAISKFVGKNKSHKDKNKNKNKKDN